MQAAPLTARQNQILRHIQEHGFVTIEALSQVFEVSTQTVRRDLIHLEKQRYLQRFHGGAGLAANMFRIGYAQKLATSKEGKQRIAAHITASIPHGASVYLDVGSTVEEIARQLCAHASLHVATPSVNVAMIFLDRPRIEVFLTGGRLRGPNGALVGEHALRAIGDLRFDYAISSFGGFDESGQPTDYDPDKIALRQGVFERATHRIGAVDESKFSKVAMRQLLGRVPFTELIVDADLPAHVVVAMKKMGTKVFVAAGSGENDQDVEDSLQT